MTDEFEFGYKYSDMVVVMAARSFDRTSAQKFLRARLLWLIPAR